MSENRRKRGGLYRQNGSPYWYADYVDRSGRRRRRSTGEKTKKAAERMRATWLNERPGPSQALTFQAMVDDLKSDYDANGRKSWKRVMQAVAHLEPLFGKQEAAQITSRGITEYRNLRIKQDASPATVRYEMAILQRMLALAQEDGKLEVMPAFPRIKVNNAREEFMTDGEFAGLMVELPTHLRGFIGFRFHTGWRSSETASIRWQDVDWENGVVRLRRGSTKNDDPREFPFSELPDLRDVLVAQRQYTDEVERRLGKEIAWVFHRQGNPIRYYRRSWIRACKRVGAIGADGKPKVPHDLRRSAARRMERAGIPRSIAMRLIGHKTENVFQRYAVVASTDLNAGVRKLAALAEADRHSLGIVEPSSNNRGVADHSTTPSDPTSYANSGGGTRTPDTRIMIPLL